MENEIKLISPEEREKYDEILNLLKELDKKVVNNNSSIVENEKEINKLIEKVDRLIQKNLKDIKEEMIEFLTDFYEKNKDNQEIAEKMIENLDTLATHKDSVEALNKLLCLLGPVNTSDTNFINSMDLQTEMNTKIMTIFKEDIEKLKKIKETETGDFNRNLIVNFNIYEIPEINKKIDENISKRGIVSSFKNTLEEIRDVLNVKIYNRELAEVEKLAKIDNDDTEMVKKSKKKTKKIKTKRPKL